MAMHPEDAQRLRFAVEPLCYDAMNARQDTQIHEIRGLLAGGATFMVTVIVERTDQGKRTPPAAGKE
jgi:hypothetical protein